MRVWICNHRLQSQLSGGEAGGGQVKTDELQFSLLSGAMIVQLLFRLTTNHNSVFSYEQPITTQYFLT